jgi:hypothetical protein
MMMIFFEDSVDEEDDCNYIKEKSERLDITVGARIFRFDMQSYKKITQQYKLLVSECHYLLHQCKLLVKLD